MADEIVMEVKSNISTVTQDVNQLSSSLDTAQQEFANLNEQIQIQRNVITGLEKEYISLQQLAISTPRTASAGYPQLLERIRETQAELKLEKIGLKELNNERRESKTTIDSMSTGTDKSIKSNTSLVGSLTRLSGKLGGVKTKYLQIIPAAKKMFLAIKTGMISTGYGAIIVALGAIIALMSQADKVSTGWGKTLIIVGTIFDVWLERVGKYANMLVDLFSGEWASAWENLKGVFLGLGDELEREIGLALVLAENQAALSKSERELSVLLAEKAIKLDELNRAAQDENATQQERIQSATEAYNLETEMGNLKTINAMSAIANMKVQIELEGDSEANLKKLADLEINLINLRRTAAGNTAKFDKTIAGINKKAEQRASSRHSKYKNRAAQKLQIQTALWNKLIKLWNKFNADRIISEASRERQLLKIQFDKDKKELNKVYDFGRNKSKAEKKIFEKHQELMETLQKVYDKEMFDIETRRLKRISDRKVDHDNLMIGLMNDYHNVSSETEKIREDAAILASDLAEMKKLDILRQANIDRLKKMKDHIDVLKEEDKSNKEKGIVREAEDQARVLKLYEGYNKEKEEVESRYTEARNLLIETQAAAALVLEAKRQKENEELEAQAATFRLERLQNESNEELEIRIKQAQKEKELADYKMELLNQGFAAVSQGLDAQAALIETNYNKEKKLAEKNGGDLEAIDAKYEEKRKKNAAKQKAMKVGMAIIDTYQGANAAYTTALAIPGAGVAMAPIAAALAVASGLANVAMIMGTDVGSGGGGGGSPGVTSSVPPSQEMMSGSFELEGGQEVEPMQAFVVSDDITNSQDKLAAIRRRATI